MNVKQQKVFEILSELSPGEWIDFLPCASRCGGQYTSADLIFALRKFDRLDIQDYLNRYADVARAAYDPIEHFVNFGIDEEREMKLLPSAQSIALSYDDFFSRKFYFNCIVSLGNGCRVAAHLKNNNLRHFSSPFDWFWNFSLSHVVDILENGPKRLFNRFEIIGKTDKNWHVKDKDIGIISMHDFPVHLSIEDHYIFFYKSIVVKYNNLINEIRNNNLILFIMSERKDDRDINYFRDYIYNRFNKRAYFLVVNNDARNIIFYKPSLHTYILYVNDINEHGDHKSNPRFWLGNIELWNKICRNISLI